jgi:hypothetical protein
MYYRSEMTTKKVGASGQTGHPIYIYTGWAKSKEK